ncbi:MAG: hypothetical protein E6H73_15095 [Betaproteobacteria bacterium]|nr:MAG: hypothetical protein E6H73_15095 [Betaproteobacteria bacterium]
MFTHRARRLAAALLLMLAPLATLAAGVSVGFDLSSPTTSPFPSDRFTRFDFTQNTFRRVNLPKPDCAVRVSDCQDIDVINTLDGFNIQPRVTVPFTGVIDVTTVNSDTVYFVNLGDTLSGQGFGHKVGINQVLWDVATKTLVFESDELLNQHSGYLIVVTNGVKDAAGDPIEAGEFDRFRHDLNFGQTRDSDVKDYRKELIDSEKAVRDSLSRIVALSVFTTQSTTADLEKIRGQIKHSHPEPADFMVGTSTSGKVRAVFPTAGIAGIQFHRQTGTAPSFTDSFLPTPALNVVPGSVARIAFGSFKSPDYETAAKYIPTTGTLSGMPTAQSTNTIQFELFLPAGTKPAGGWPVAIFGHGFGDSMYGAPWVVASVFASQGIATIAINVVGHGGGALGTLNVLRTAGDPVVIPAGGRGFDQDGNGTIDSTEGVFAAAPRTIINSRDGLRQTVVDLMQLTREIEVGMDVDGDGVSDLNADRIYYSGQSFGGIYGTMFIAVEPSIKAGVPNVPGGSVVEAARLGQLRFLVAVSLATRQPQLLNLPSTPNVPPPFNLNFNEDIPLRNLPPVINNVPGATDIQVALENTEWVSQSGNPVAYAQYIRTNPLPGNAAKPVIIQFAKGDKTVPNPTATALVRAGDLADRATFFRNDLAFVATGGAIPKNPHTFLTNISISAAAPFAFGAQSQIAAFFASNGALTIDPDGPGPIFEVPIVPPLPEGLNFIP